MKANLIFGIIVTFLALNCSATGDSVSEEWNDKAPYSFAETLGQGKSLKKEIPDFHRDFRLQLEWKGGKVIKDPNEIITFEIELAEKAFSQIFKPKVMPSKSIKGKILLLEDVKFNSGPKDVLVFRFKKGKYIIKVMKTLGYVTKTFITVRPTSKDPVNIKQLSQDLFNDRILPGKWEAPLYYGNLKRKSKVFIAGAWLPRDNWIINDSGELLAKDRQTTLENGPIGIGLYKRVDCYTSGKFALFKLLASAMPSPSETKKTGTTRNK